MKAQPETPSAVSATVEPASSNDWEVVEQNAAYMEEQLLNQARCAVWHVSPPRAAMQCRAHADSVGSMIGNL